MADTIQVRNKSTGEIVTLRKKESKQETGANAFPEISQAVGSVVGTSLGGIPSGAIGAGVGRILGETGERAGLSFSPSSSFVAPQSIDSQVANIQNLFSGLIGGAGEYVSSDKEKALQTIKNAAVASGSDLTFGVAGALAGKTLSFINKGISRGLFGKEVADRLMARPEQVFSKLKGGFEDTAKKSKYFFDNLSKKVGGEVELAIMNNSKNYKQIDDVVKNILDNTDNGAAVQFLDIPKSQKSKISNIINDVIENKGKQVNAETVWNLRKNVDKVIKRMSPTSEGRQMLYGIRSELANKLKTFSSDISQKFADYSFVQEADETIGRYLKGIKTPKGEVISPRLEQFTKTLLKSDKTETINLLEQINSMAGKDMQIAEDILDIAASEGIARDIGGGVLSRIALQTLGGSQNIAKFLSLPNSEKARIIGNIQKSLVATGTTTALTRE